MGWKHCPGPLQSPALSQTPSCALLMQGGGGCGDSYTHTHTPPGIPCQGVYGEVITLVRMDTPGDLNYDGDHMIVLPHQTPPAGIGWLGRRTRLKACLILVVVVTLTVSLTAVAISKQNSSKTFDCGGTGGHDGGTPDILSTEVPSPAEGVCLTKGCVKAATRLIASMDESVDPCEDFYQFACGGFLKKTIIPDDQTHVTRFSQLSSENKQKLRGLVEAEDTPTESNYYKIVKNFFKSCMDTETIERKGLAPMKDILRQMGGWPVLEGAAWDPSAFNWTHNIYINRQLGYPINFMFSLEVLPNAKNSSWRIIYIDQPDTLGLSREYLIKGFNRSVVQAYYNYQINMAVLLGADRATAEKELEESLEFEIQIAKYCLSYKQRLTTQSKRITIGELAILVPEIPWLEYINHILSPFHTVTLQEPLVVLATGYLQNLAKLLDTTPKRVIANYMLWRVTEATVFSLTDDALDLQLKYFKKYTGKRERNPRWHDCMAVVSEGLSYAVGSMYAREFFREEAKSAAEDMVVFIRRQFEEMLQTQDWMDPITRRTALEKARAITPHVGYPPEALMDDKVAEKYDGLVITKGDFLENLRNRDIFDYESSFKRLREVVNKTLWRNYRGADVNAFYDSKENSIKLPAGILQGIFFEPDQPRYMNFGGVGYIIGHEITHGFDNLGRNYDASGNLNNWWGEETSARYVQKALCVVHQYENYTVPEVNRNLKGLRTLAENIADNGGIKVAYQAYSAWTQDFGEEKKLPSLPYTPKQLFWLSAANTWCSKYRPETFRFLVLTGTHSPARFRVNGPFSNRPEFAEDWKCPAGSKLNPVKKCSVW